MSRFCVTKQVHSGAGRGSVPVFDASSVEWKSAVGTGLRVTACPVSCFVLAVMGGQGSDRAVNFPDAVSCKLKACQGAVSLVC